MASEDNRLSDLERLIAEEKEDKARQNGLIDRRNKTAKRKKVAVIATVATTSVALIAGLLIYDPFTQSIRWENKDTTVGSGFSGDTNNGSVPAANDPYGWAKTSGSIFPVDTKEWEEKSFLDNSQAGALKEKQAKYATMDFSESLMDLPTEANGFTSDDSKSFNDDGSLNPLYSYWTQESFYNETVDMLERIINPVYGGWSQFQFSESMGIAEETIPDLFKDIVSPEVYAGGAKGIPILADWNKDDFGMKDQLLENGEGKRWLGEVTSAQSEFSFNEDKNQYEVILVANVTYSAWTKDKGTVTKDGVLTLNLVANNDKAVDSPKKVIIKSASLELK